MICQFDNLAIDVIGEDNTAARSSDKETNPCIVLDEKNTHLNDSRLSDFLHLGCARSSDKKTRIEDNTANTDNLAIDVIGEDNTAAKFSDKETNPCRRGPFIVSDEKYTHLNDLTLFEFPFSP